MGETLEALVKGLQGSLWELGGVPQVVRSDNLSAATHELKNSRGRALSERYGAVLDHYDIRATTTNVNAPHENGVAEQAHFGLQPAAVWAVLAIAVELIASLCLIAGRWVWLAAGALGVLTLVAMVVANDFWHLQGQARFMALNAFFEHLGLIAGLACAARIALLKRQGTG